MAGIPCREIPRSMGATSPSKQPRIKRPENHSLGFEQVFGIAYRWATQSRRTLRSESCISVTLFGGMARVSTACM